MKKKIVAAVVILVSAALLICYFIFRTFSSYEVKASAALTEAAGTTYETFGDSVIGVSRDGVKCLDNDGNLLWAQSFEMGSPVTEQSGDSLIIYDRGGSEANVFSKEGKKVMIKANGTLSRAAVSKSGASAILTDDGDSHVIVVYAADGTEIANGELHTANTGYPIALALSPSGSVLCVSALDLSQGDIKTSVLFYDFSKGGSSAKNNITAQFSYSGIVIPMIRYFDDGRAVAFSDSEVIVFSPSSSPVVEKEIFPKEKIRSVLTSGKSFGIVTGEERFLLTKYSSSGKVRFEKRIDFPLIKAEFLSNDELAVRGSEKLELYTIFGIKKFSYDFPEGVAGIMPWDGSANYVLITGGRLEKVHLK